MAERRQARPSPEELEQINLRKERRAGRPQPLNEIFSLKVAGKLAKMAGRPDNIRTQWLYHRLNDEAKILRAAGEFANSTTSFKDARRELGDLIELADPLVAGLEELDPTTKGLLTDIYKEYDVGGSEVPESGQTGLSNDRAFLRRLRNALYLTRRRIPIESGGAPGLGIYHDAALAFIELYERASREKFRWYCPRTDGVYQWNSAGSATKFVFRAIRKTFPSVTDANLASVMRGKRLRPNDLQEPPS